jgi:hypothetical protein
MVDLRSGSVKGEVPFANVSFSKTLNGVSSFSGTLNLADPGLVGVDPIDATLPGRSALFVDYNGSLVWGGIVWPREYTHQAQTQSLTVTASDIWSYFTNRVQATDYSAPPYSGITGTGSPMAIWDATSSGSTWDPVLIAWQVVADAIAAYSPSPYQPAATSYGNILGGLAIAANGNNTAASYIASGTNTPASSYVNATYPYSTLQTVDTIVKQLAGLGLGVGFDFGIDVAYSAGAFSVPVATLNFSYPRRGRTFAQNNLMVDLSTAISYSFPEDGTQIGNVIYETGGSGAIGVTQNINPLLQGYPILERVISRSNITSSNVLNLLSQLGISDAYLYSYAPVVPQFTVDLFGDNPHIGNFIEGDDLRVYLPATDTQGQVWDPRFPYGIDQEWRITQWTAKVTDSGQSTLTCVLNQPPVGTTTTGPAI